jgi:hypothetical protein
MTFILCLSAGARLLPPNFVGLIVNLMRGRNQRLSDCQEQGRAKRTAVDGPALFRGLRPMDFGTSEN